jgi:hypothetical protein
VTTRKSLKHNRISRIKIASGGISGIGGIRISNIKIASGRIVNIKIASGRISGIRISNGGINSIQITSGRMAGGIMGAGE